jgi:hypothetical protein
LLNPRENADREWVCPSPALAPIDDRKSMIRLWDRIDPAEFNG